MRRALKLGFLLLGLLLLLSILLVGSSLPRTGGEHRVDGLEAPVVIRMDKWQRPFVEAQSLSDALFAQGWLHGSHRLWQMELHRRAGSGRLAQLLGAEMLEADRELWRVGVPELATRLQRNASDSLLARVEAYVAGVNQALQDTAVLPPEFLLLRSAPAPWQASDVFAVGALVTFQSANNYRKELLRLALRNRLGAERFALFVPDGAARPDYPYVLQDPSGLVSALQRARATDPAHNPRMPRLAFGSNGWVVSPSRTRDGHALFAFDSHDKLGLPNLFYELHLFYGDGRQLRGWSAPGLPGVINGFNQAIAWGFTNIGDTQDLFVETRSIQDPGLFLQDGQWYRARSHSVNIPVRGQAQPEVLHITTTRNGRLVSEQPALALRWTVHERDDLSLESLLDLNQATSWSQFNKALDRFPAPTLNATYADTGGTIGFRTAGLIPLRGAGRGLYPLPGDDSANGWQGLAGPEQMPRRVNPPRGFLAAANARVQPAGAGPLVSADNAAPYRIERLRRVLQQADQWTLEDMQALQTDWHDQQAASLLPLLLPLVTEPEAAGHEAVAIQLLQAWQAHPVADPGSAAALIFQRWYIALAREVFAAALGDDLFDELLRQAYPLNAALDELIRREHDPWWQPGKARVVHSALRASLAQLQRELGEDDPRRWVLSDLHRVQLAHELSAAVPGLGWLLDSKTFGWGGSTSTVGRAAYGYHRPNRVSHAATVRVVAEMRDVPVVRAVMPGGQSGMPFSAHYLDQLPAWLAGELHAVDAHDTVTELRLTPRQ